MSGEFITKIPVLDLADFNSGVDLQKKKFVNDLGAAFQEIGFVAITNHHLSDSLSKELYSEIKKFFDLSDEVKQQYEVAGLFGQRGYVGKGKEHAKGRKTGDLKEFFHIGQEIQLNENQSENFPKNIWPKEFPAFKSTAIQVYRQLEKTGIDTLRAIALFLDLPENYFDDRVKYGNSILRPIHYFPVEDPSAVPPDAVRAAAHGDINLITLLMGASAEGLQVLNRNNEWISVTAAPDQLIINVGDMLERLTNGKLRSTIHRVVNPPPERLHLPRYSIPFFMHPRSEMSLAALPNCVDQHHPKRWSDITAGEFLNQRLKEIGLKT
jgi:isopenicillin N synthase-like dioxygenase